MAVLQPMLGANEDWNESKVAKHIAREGFLIMEPKFDGIRSLFYDGTARSRSWKLHGSTALQKFAADNAKFLHGVDSEVTPGHEVLDGSFRQAMSDIRGAGGSEKFTIFVFDQFLNPGLSYLSRLSVANHQLEGIEYMKGPGYDAKIVICPYVRIESLEEMYAHEEALLATTLSKEGAMLRVDRLPYKYGRSSYSHGGLMKLKRYTDVDAVVVGYEPWFENTNAPHIDAYGRQKRSSHNAGMVAMDRLGAWKCRLIDEFGNPFGEVFAVGVLRGVSQDERDRLWANRDAYIGRICKLKRQAADGGYDKPRTPVWLAWRDPADVGTVQTNL